MVSPVKHETFNTPSRRVYKNLLDNPASPASRGGRSISPVNGPRVAPFGSRVVSPRNNVRLVSPTSRVQMVLPKPAQEIIRREGTDGTQVNTVDATGYKRTFVTQNVNGRARALLSPPREGSTRMIGVGGQELVRQSGEIKGVSYRY